MGKERKTGFPACRCITFYRILGCHLCLNLLEFDGSFFVSTLYPVWIVEQRWQRCFIGSTGHVLPKISRSQVDTESGRTRAVPGLPPGFQGNWTRVPFNDTASAAFKLTALPNAHVYRHFPIFLAKEERSHNARSGNLDGLRRNTRSDVVS